MARVFTEQDSTGRSIYLTTERWKHINQEHPEVAQHIEEIQATLKEKAQNTSHPLEHIAYYYRHVKERKAHLLVIVKYLNGEGFILTAYFVRRR